MTFTHRPLSTKIIDIPNDDTPTGRFYVTPTGDRYPSITTVLGHKVKEGILEWRQSMGEVAADIETKRAADRGSDVHLMIERYLQNDTDCKREMPPSSISVFMGIRGYLNARVNNIVMQETALWSDQLKVAGRVDCIGEYNKTLSVIDFKTSTRFKPIYMIEDYFLQTTAYALMARERYNLDIGQVAIIMGVEMGLPQLWCKRIDDYIEPLKARLQEYYDDIGQ